MSVTTVNNTAGPEELVPMLLVIGILSRILIRPVLLPENYNQMETLRIANAEMSRMVMPDRIAKALTRHVASSTEVS